MAALSPGCELKRSTLTERLTLQKRFRNCCIYGGIFSPVFSPHFRLDV